MRIPVFLAVAQWTLLLALGLLVIVMYRQLGRAYGRARQPAELGPAVGSRAAGFGYTRVNDPGEAAGGRPRWLTLGDGQPVLLAFVDPTCPACEEVVAVLDAAAQAGQLAGLRTLLLISDPPSYLRISEVFQATRLEIGRPADRAELETYRVSATPLLVAIDGAGLVRSAGAAVRQPEVRAYIQACLLPPPERTLDIATAGRPEPSHVGPVHNHGPGSGARGETMP
jgi:hypothetical protein